MLRSLYTGISGLRSHQTMMDVTGNNIANVNTTGFKSSATLFADTLSQTMSNATAPQNGNGGTSPAQVGLGVRVAGITTNFSQGATQVTGRSTDMLISGDGFFVVNQNGQNFYTRNGSFDLDANGTLVNTEGGALQGWTAAGGAVDTTGVPGPMSIPVGTLIPPKATTTMAVTGNLNALTPDAVPVPMSFKVYDTAGTPADVRVSFTVAARDGDVATSWDAEYTYNGVTAPLGTVEFDPQGKLTAPVLDADGKALITFPALTGSNGQTFTPTLDVAKLNGTANGTSDGPSTAKIATGDGFPAAALTSWKVAADGSITGTFSNGQTNILGRVALANFNNQSGLEKVGGSRYAATVNSGNAVVGVAGQDGRGTLVTGALEMSNVDLAQEFTNLIVSQRGFQANSRIITSSDEMLQELVNLKR